MSNHFPAAIPPDKIAQKGATMILNREQQTAIESGVPVAMIVAGTDCILVRKDIYLRMEPEFDTGSWTAEELNMLADEAEEMISRGESRDH